VDFKELERRLGAVRSKPENIPIESNPNCFIDGFECDVDPTVVLKVYICTYTPSIYVCVHMWIYECSYAYNF
jgi:hypothetical protein